MNEPKNESIFLSIGMVRGLIGFVAGMLAGGLLVTLIRLVLGLTAWDPNTFGFTKAPGWWVRSSLPQVL